MCEMTPGGSDEWLHHTKSHKVAQNSVCILLAWLALMMLVFE